MIHLYALALAGLGFFLAWKSWKELGLQTWLPRLLIGALVLFSLLFTARGISPDRVRWEAPTVVPLTMTLAALAILVILWVVFVAEKKSGRNPWESRWMKIAPLVATSLGLLAMIIHIMGL